MFGPGNIERTVERQPERFEDVDHSRTTGLTKQVADSQRVIYVERVRVVVEALEQVADVGIGNRQGRQERAAPNGLELIGEGNPEPFSGSKLCWHVGIVRGRE